MLSFLVRPGTEGTVTGGSFGAESFPLATVEEAAGIVEDEVTVLDAAAAAADELPPTGGPDVGNASDPGVARASLFAAQATMPAETIITAIGASRFTKRSCIRFCR